MSPNDLTAKLLEEYRAARQPVAVIKCAKCGVEANIANWTENERDGFWNWLIIHEGIYHGKQH
jgi:hypothetical protein